MDAKRRNEEHLRRYLPTNTVNRLLQVLPLSDTRSLGNYKERLKRLTHLNESVLLVLRYINSNLGDKQTDGHYEACTFNQYSTVGTSMCMCYRFRTALYDIEKYVLTEDERMHI